MSGGPAHPTADFKCLLAAPRQRVVVQQMSFVAVDEAHPGNPPIDVPIVRHFAPQVRPAIGIVSPTIKLGKAKSRFTRRTPRKHNRRWERSWTRSLRIRVLKDGSWKKVEKHLAAVLLQTPI